MLNPTHRFSTKVDDYHKYRPGYPQAVIDLLQRQCGLTDAGTVADIGSGTGIFTALLLHIGCHVLAIEPNAPMRLIAEQTFTQNKRFTSINAPAECTTLPDHSIDLVTAAQAFHWFDSPQTRREFQRIIKPVGWVALIWNDRKIDDSPFLIAYEQLLKTYSTDYHQVTHKQAAITKPAAFFAPNKCCTATFTNHQVFDFDALRGRVLSSSYIPDAGPKHDALLVALRDLFDHYHQNGHVRITYDTQVYYGQLST